MKTSIEEDWAVDGYTSRRMWSLQAADSRRDALRKAIRRLRRCRGRVRIYRGLKLVWERGSANATCK